MRSSLSPIISLLSVCLFSCSFGHCADWNTTGEWVFLDGGRYFPLGIWPTPSMTAEDIRPADMLYVHRTIDYDPDVMGGKALMIGSSHFQWVFSGGYNGNFPGYINNGDEHIDYDEMQGLLRIDESSFEFYIDRRVLRPWSTAVDPERNPDRVWFSIDEPDHFGYSRRTWCWNPELLRRMNRAVKTAGDPNDLMIVSFGPPKEGNIFFYDRNIPSVNDVPEPPVTRDAYKRHFDNTAGGGLDPERYFNDVRYTVTAYREAGDVWMLNDYHTFFRAPEYAGIAVDAIHAAIDSVGGDSWPVWLWFGPGLIDYHPSYGADKFACQIYTAIAHGCTGVFMYCSANPDYVDHLSATDWEAAEAVLTELRSRRRFLLGRTMQRGVMQSGRLHYSIRRPAEDSPAEVLVTNSGDRPLIIDPGVFEPAVTLQDSVFLPPYGYRFLSAAP